MRRLRRALALSSVFSLTCSLVHAQTMVQKRCGTGVVRLRGSITNMGVNYQEIVIIEKIGRSSSHDGDWRMKSYQQVITYPAPIPISIDTIDVAQISPGIFMKVHGYTRGNQVITETVENNVVFTIRNGTFYYKANMKAIGTVTGDRLRFKWDQTNPLLPEDSGNLRGDYQDVSVSLLQPGPVDRRFVFNVDKPGLLTIKARARVEPAEYAGRLQWQFGAIKGSEMSATPADLRGPEVEVVFKGLPESNAEFGPKEVRASLNVDGCEMYVRQTVELFYPIATTNNPSNNLPNWYYYWRQTPAARPENEGVVTEYEGRFQGGCKLWPYVPMHYPLLHGGGNGRIRVCDLANIQGRFFTYEFPKLSRDLNAIEPREVGRFDGFRTIRFIDLFAAGLLHEYQHKTFDERWRSGKTPAQVALEDRDSDGIPDEMERRGDMRFIVGMKQSWFQNHPTLSRIEYDEEWLAYEIQDGYVDGGYDKYDWAKPGKQWPDP